MKKLKILPSILMLTLCIAILGVGVFAVAPTQNTISGTITINSANTPVSIQLLIDGVAKGDSVTVRSGTTFDIGDLTFNTSGVNSVNEVKNRKITLSVTNLSTTQSLGVYFFKNGTNLVNGMADVENIMLEKDIYATGDEEIEANKMATAYFTPYYYLGKSDGNATIDYENEDGEYDNVEMNITFECYQLFTTNKTYDFNFKLNIEPYVGNVEDSDLVQTTPILNENDNSFDFSKMETSTFDKQFVKISENVNTIPPEAFYNNQSQLSHMVVVPSTCNFEAYYDLADSHCHAFNGLKHIKTISINNNILYDSWYTSKGFLEGEVVAINSDIMVLYPFASNDITKRLELSSKVTLNEFNNIYGCTNLKLVIYEISGEGYIYKDGTLTITSSLTRDNEFAWDEANINPLILNVEWTEDAMQGTTIIPRDSFYGCNNLTSIEIPSGVTSIGYSFNDCLSLMDITIKSGLDLTAKYNLPSLNKEGYTFNGWYTTRDTSGTKVTEISNEPYTKDTTYYTVWTKNS